MDDKSANTPLLQFHDVTAYRNDTKVLDQFSMTIKELDHTAIVGPNGAGKSTFIQLITHQLHPMASKNEKPPIRVFGKERWNVAELRKRIGIVSTDLEQDIAHNLQNGRLSGRAVVISGFFSSMQLFKHHTIDDAMREKANEALSLMDSMHLGERLFSRMSAGEARRVLIARALVTSPDLLVLDEPTTALDMVARKKCLRLIQKIAREGTTVIIVTHHIGEIIPEIVNVVLLKDGRSAYSGQKNKVLSSKNISDVYDHSITLHQNENQYRVELNTPGNF